MKANTWIYRYGEAIRAYRVSDGRIYTSRKTAVAVQRRLDRERKAREAERLAYLEDLDHSAFGFLV